LRQQLESVCARQRLQNRLLLAATLLLAVIVALEVFALLR
jgi:hypothetical protein